uniref:migration and invasion enhancer 1-like n=1 Tax=Oncorhynchus gorbuscha TaxID=8017 RepID=UPI001EAF463C|nr:migration and invasion enhancer 1-like [Oncorhynchus gorbuscha]
MAPGIIPELDIALAKLRANTGIEWGQVWLHEDAKAAAHRFNSSKRSSTTKSSTMQVSAVAGYESRYQDLASAIKRNVPDVTIITGRRSSLEVTVNGKLAYSKLGAGGFPDTKEMVAMVKDVSRGGKVEKVKKKDNKCFLQ